MTSRFYEDFRPGETIDLGTYPVHAEEIIEFAEQFDPAPFHLSEEGGRNTMVGGLCASGWHCCAMAMRMMCDSFLMEASGQGAPGIDKVEWRIPVRPGDVLSGTAHILSARLSRSRQGIGIVAFRFEFFTNPTEPAFTIENSIMFALRKFDRQQEQAVQQ
jgi:acyl dehydratase